MSAAPFPMPDLGRILALVADDAREGRLDLWGRSTVIDENTREPVIDRALFDRLHAAARIPARFPVGNAGVIHVYGYWFSAALTPYGYKRDRWQDGALAAALGEDQAAFRLEGAGTPLQRVTAAALPRLRERGSAERGRADAVVDGRETRVVLISAAPSSLSGDALSVSALVYGVDRGDGWRLITTFPFSGDGHALLEDFRGDPRWRWNAAETAAD